MPVYDPQRNEMARRMGSGGQGAAPGGLSPAMGSPPPRPGVGGQHPPGGAPQQMAGPSRLEPMLQQVLQILVEGRPEDLDAFGKFQGQLAELVLSHQQGQGMPQQTQAGAGTPGMPPTPQLG